MLEKYTDTGKTLNTFQEYAFERWLVKRRYKRIPISTPGRLYTRKKMASRNVMRFHIKTDMREHLIPQSHRLANAQTFIINSNRPGKLTYSRVAFNHQRLNSSRAQQIRCRQTSWSCSHNHYRNPLVALSIHVISPF